VDGCRYIDAGAALYRTTTRDIAAAAKIGRGTVKVDVRPLRHERSESIAISITFTGAYERILPARQNTAEITMWPWVIGSLSLAAVVSQIVIALCRRAQAATESDPHEGW
jgi:hypothetical protein